MSQVRQASIFEGLSKDLQFAIRQLRHRPGFAITAVLVLALGLGANAAIFSIVNAVLLRPLPYPNEQTLVYVFERDVVNNSEEDHYNWVSPGSLHDWMRSARSVSALSAVRHVSFNNSNKSQSFTPQRVQGIACSYRFASILGVSPALGRFFTKSEDSLTAPYVAVISNSFWKSRFAESRDVLGRQILLDGNNYTIVGVLPGSFAFPGQRAEVYVSFEHSVEPYNRESHSNHFFEVIGRLTDGFSTAQAQQEISAIVHDFRRDHPAEVMGKAATVIPMNQYLVRHVKTSLLILLGAVGCVLLIACVNIANLLLTRALGRQRELAIRAAVGANRGQIIRQLLIESLTLSLLGAIAGLLIASWTSSFLATHAPGADQLPQLATVRIDRAVFSFTACTAILSGILAGLFPALVASRTDLVTGLKETSRSSTGSRSHAKIRNTLVGVEVAVSLVLLIGAGLLLRSFFNVEGVKPGFHTENSVTFAVSLPEAVYKKREAVSNFIRRLSEGLRATPGVSSAGLVNYPPLGGHYSDSVYHVKGHPLPTGAMMDLLYQSADPGYFKAVGIPLIRGRFFTERDGVGFDDKNPQLGQAIISESTARKFFANRDPIGEILEPGTDAGLPPDPQGNPYWNFQIVGVVGDVPSSLEAGIQPTIYTPLLDGDNHEFYGILHSPGDPLALTERIRSQVHRIDPDIPVHDVRTFAQINNRVTDDRRFSVALLSLFAGVAVVLAAVGLYGVVSYAVSQRTSEIGIRMALGAGRQEVSRLVLLEGLKPALLGLIAGIFAAVMLSRLLKSMLVGVTAMDSATFFAVPLTLGVVATLACLFPALRATRIDPTVALRVE